MPAVPRHGPDRFIADLTGEGVVTRVEGPAVVYTVVPAIGALANVAVDAAVSVSELQSWPTVVPHWLHFREAITFSHTNTDTNDCLRGWLRHSRDIGQWDASVPAARAWMAYVRGVLSTATKAN
jgi:hypothetical protein